MTMNFWEAQRRARKLTFIYLTVFFILALLIAIGIEYAVRFLAKEGYTPQIPFLGLVFLGITFLVAGFYYLTYKSYGGQFVAESMGGYEVFSDTSYFKEKQLFNIVEEMAVASRNPMPQVFVIEAQEINAFAAGIKPEQAAITVTTGALEYLTRDELQAVVAHEFGHISNGDMKINMRLAAMIMGFVFILYFGLRILEGSLLFGRGRRNGNGGSGNTVALIALIFLVAGAITWFAGAILRSLVSRQREYLADASSVQYTRNPQSMINALRKLASLQDVQDMPKKGMAYSHLYFDNHSFWATLFATHPPIEKRIAAIEGKA